MIISINGAEGSGKSTISKLLAKKLAWPQYNIGKIRREKAKEKNLSLAEYNKLGESEPSTDLEVDEYQKKLGEEKDNFIIEGRTSWYFIPHSLKLYIDVDEKIGAERIFKELQENNQRNEGENLGSLEAVLKSNRARRKSDQKRYKKYFNINVRDLNNYDFYIDSSNLSIEEVFAECLAFVSDKIKSKI